MVLFSRYIILLISNLLFLTGCQVLNSNTGVEREAPEVSYEYADSSNHSTVNEIEEELTVTQNEEIDEIEQIHVQVLEEQNLPLTNQNTNNSMNNEVTEDVNSLLSLNQSLEDSQQENIVGQQVIIELPNTPPVANNDSYETLEDTAIRLENLLHNSVDTESENLIIVDFKQGNHGGVVSRLDGNTLFYTPTENFSGIEEFEYVVTDESEATAVAKVIINVLPVNDKPIVQNEYISLNEDQSISISGLLQNDDDIDGDQLIIKEFSQGDMGGLIEKTGEDIFKYSPKQDFNGLERFSYFVSDGAGELVEGVVELNVQAVNDIPFAKSDSYTFMQSETMNLNVINNDTGVGDGVRISIISQPRYGSVEVDNEELLFIPNADYFGKDEFFYEINDSDGDSSVASVSMEIICVSECVANFKLSWNASVSADIVGYNVYLGSQDDAFDSVFEIGNVTNFNYQVAKKGEYFFAISAVNEHGLESTLTETFSGIF